MRTLPGWLMAGFFTVVGAFVLWRGLPVFRAPADAQAVRVSEAGAVFVWSIVGLQLLLGGALALWVWRMARRASRVDAAAAFADESYHYLRLGGSIPVSEVRDGMEAEKGPEKKRESGPQEEWGRPADWWKGDGEKR